MKKLFFSLIFIVSAILSLTASQPTIQFKADYNWGGLSDPLTGPGPGTIMKGAPLNYGTGGTHFVYSADTYSTGTVIQCETYLTAATEAPCGDVAYSYSNGPQSVYKSYTNPTASNQWAYRYTIVIWNIVSGTAQHAEGFVGW